MFLFEPQELNFQIIWLCDAFLTLENKVSNSDCKLYFIWADIPSLRYFVAIIIIPFQPWTLFFLDLFLFIPFSEDVILSNQRFLIRTSLCRSCCWCFCFVCYNQLLPFQTESSTCDAVCQFCNLSHHMLVYFRAKIWFVLLLCNRSHFEGKNLFFKAPQQSPSNHSCSSEVPARLYTRLSWHLLSVSWGQCVGSF